MLTHHIREDEMEILLERLRDRQNGHHHTSYREFDPDPLVTPSGQIAILGLPGSGKKTIYNGFWGWEVLPSGDKAKTSYQLGTLTLLRLPHDPQSEDFIFHPEDFDLIIYVLNAQDGLNSAEFQWYTKLRASHTPLLVVINTPLEVQNTTLSSNISDIERRLARKVIPLDAANMQAFHEVLLPALLVQCPQFGKILASDIPSLREKVARHFIKQTMFDVSKIGFEFPAELDENTLLVHQIGLIKQIAEVFGYPPPQDSWLLIGATFILQQIRPLIQEASTRRTGQSATWSFITAASTWLIGQLAILFYQANGWPFKSTPKG